MLPRSATFIGLLMAVLAQPAVAQAAVPAVHQVTNSNDSGTGSLRAAVDAATTGDTVKIPPGTYRLTSGALNVDQAFTLDGQGARAADVTITAEGHSRTLCVSNPNGTATLRRIKVTGGVAPSGGVGPCGSLPGGGILKGGDGSLVVDETTIAGNTTTGGASGGGLAVVGGDAQVRRSAVVSNTASGGGAGILNSNTLSVENSTIGDNRLTGNGAGGSALLTTGGVGTATTLDFVTIARNTGTGGALTNAGSATTALTNTVVAYNGADCSGTIGPGNNNAASDTSCNLGGTNRAPIHPNLGPLADNGGPTPTYAIAPSPAPGDEVIDKGSCGVPSVDQRGAPRRDPTGGCDIGAFEFDGVSIAQIPDCTRSGQIPFTVIAPPTSGVEAFRFKIAGGPQQKIGFGGGATGSGTITVPEGRIPIEFWGDSFPPGEAAGGEFHHHTPLVVVDRTNPTIAVKNPNKFKVFVIKRAVKVKVSAADSISGLAQDPAGTPKIDTSHRGRKTFEPKAVDRCDNAKAAGFSFQVLAPKLGTRLVVEEVSGNTKIRASAKGQSFKALKEPRELRIGSLVDTRRGRVRLTVSKDSKTAIQDGTFVGGLFQVLQSRKRKSKGLTELRLKGASFKSCAGVGGARSSGKRAETARGKRVIRRLRGNGRGRFRTRGRYSAATVRGTDWTVEDRCDGTLTKVKRGRVTVRDFRRHRTITLRAGKQYLARP